LYNLLKIELKLSIVSNQSDSPAGQSKLYQIINISTEMQRSYLDYSMSVIVSRALPDIRDGLKPVHRRIIYSMYESGFFYNKPYRKSARIVGDVIGKYHPHSDAAIYDSLVRMAQEFSLREPLVDGQGNFGSIDGDPPASMRYTESRLTKISNYLVEDIKYDTVDFRDNYDGSETEPTVFPAVFPNLLVNGSGGIAVGMATNIPPHNLLEVMDACISYVDNEDMSLDEISQIISGPDFPTSGMIMGTKSINTAYNHGKGIIKIRGRINIEQTAGKSVIVIYEIPYMVNKSKMIQKIAELVNEKTIQGISDVRDESNRQGIRVVIELKKDAVEEVIINQLYKLTPLQTSFGINMLAIDGGLPRLLNIKDIIVAFVKFRKEVVVRRTEYFLKGALNRSHILLGLYLTVSNIDKVVSIVKGSNNPEEARLSLMKIQWDFTMVKEWVLLIEDKSDDKEEVNNNLYQFSEKQAKAILDMKLQRLTGLEKNKISSELELLMNNIKEYKEILSSKQKLVDLIKSEFKEVKDLFGTPRLTEINPQELVDQDIEDFIPKEDMVVTSTLKGYIKRVPLETYRAQKRGGKGKSGMNMNEEDITTDIFVDSTHSTLLFFTNKGLVYTLRLHELPLGSATTKGRPIMNVLQNLDKNERITKILPVSDDVEYEKLNIVFATARGLVRRNSLSDFRSIRQSGKIAIKLEDDQLVDVRICKDEECIMLATKMGKAISFLVNEMRVFKSRSSSGVKGITLNKKDEVVNMSVLGEVNYPVEQRSNYLEAPIKDRLKIIEGTFKHNTLDAELAKTMAQKEKFILSITSGGYGKMSSVYEYTIRHRGGQGVANISKSKVGEVVIVMSVQPDDEIIVATNKARVIRVKLSEIRITGRSSRGVILTKVQKDEEIISAALVD
jgi:DNA gyrase subunit A